MIAFWILAALFAICAVMFVLLVPSRPVEAGAPKKDVKIT